MSVSVHSPEGVVVVSLWHEEVCSGTFDSRCPTLLN